MVKTTNQLRTDALRYTNRTALRKCLCVQNGTTERLDPNHRTVSLLATSLGVLLVIYK